MTRRSRLGIGLRWLFWWVLVLVYFWSCGWVSVDYEILELWLGLTKEMNGF